MKKPTRWCRKCEQITPYRNGIVVKKRRMMAVMIAGGEKNERIV